LFAKIATLVAEAISYIDTSALLKWYLNESASTEVAEWIETQQLLTFSRLGWLEFRCALHRRLRARTLSEAEAMDALHEFSADVEAGAFTLLPLTDEQALAADQLLAQVQSPLRTLDALHLAGAMSQRAAYLATADRVMAAAAESLGMNVSHFGGR